MSTLHLPAEWKNSSPEVLPEFLLIVMLSSCLMMQASFLGRQAKRHAVQAVGHEITMTHVLVGTEDATFYT